MKKPDSKGFRLPVLYIIFIILLCFCYAGSAKAQDTAWSQPPPPEYNVTLTPLTPLTPVDSEPDNPILTFFYFMH